MISIEPRYTNSRISAVIANINNHHQIVTKWDEDPKVMAHWIEYTAYKYDFFVPLQSATNVIMQALQDEPFFTHAEISRSYDMMTDRYTYTTECFYPKYQQRERVCYRTHVSFEIMSMLSPDDVSKLLEDDIIEGIHHACGIRREYIAPVLSNVFTVHGKVPGGISLDSFKQSKSVQLSDMADKLPVTEKVVCPVDGCSFHEGTAHTVRYCIIHLNDEHKWTREAIADWLDELADAGKIHIDLEVKPDAVTT